MRKVVGGFGKKSCVSTGVRKPGNTWVTDSHDMTLAVKVVLNPNTTNQPTNYTENSGYNHSIPCSIHDSIPDVFSPLTSAEACEKSRRWLWIEIVLVLV